MANPKVLAVDDEAFNLDILSEYLERDGYEVITASDGMRAIEALSLHPDIAVIVLDRMMPRMDGMQVLQAVKAHDQWKEIPVIMQTAAALSEQVLQGIQAGAYYYLVKPYTEAVLRSIVRAALENATQHNQLKEQIRKQMRMLALMEHSRFRFRTLSEAHSLAYYISCCFPEPERVVYGLNELLVNAIEHGNLGITYEQKRALIMEGRWQQEVDYRQTLPEHADKYATLTFSSDEEAIAVHIKDMGTGFDWKPFLELSAERATDPHGRGIATSRMMSFDHMEYIGCGNEIICKVVSRR